MRNYITAIAILLTLGAGPASAGKCSNMQAGNEFTVLQRNLEEITGTYELMGETLSDHRPIAIAPGESFKILRVLPKQYTDPQLYQVLVGGKIGVYQCYMFDINAARQDIIPKSNFDYALLNVGKEVWVSKEFDKLYTSPKSERPFKDQHSQMAIVKDWEQGRNLEEGSYHVMYYTIEFMSGGRAYIPLPDFYAAMREGKILTHPAEVAAAKELHEQAEKQRLEKEQKETQESEDKQCAEAVAEMKAAGVTEGKTFWLKWPDFGMAGASRLKILKIAPQFEDKKSIYRDRIDRDIGGRC